MNRHTHSLVTLGFFLGLGMIGCTERNPAFHKPADAGVNPSRDVAASDTPVSVDHPPTDTLVAPEDAELLSDATIVIADAGPDSQRPVDAQGEAGSQRPDALRLDGRAEAGVIADTKPARDARFDTWVADGAVSPPPDVPPANPDVEHPDGSAVTEDAPLEIDAPEADTPGVVDVLPDVEPDAWPDAEDTELESI